MSIDDSLSNALNNQLFNTIMQRCILLMFPNYHDWPIQQLGVDELSENLSIPHLLFFGLVAPDTNEEVHHSIEANQKLANVSCSLEQEVLAVDVLTDV